MKDFLVVGQITKAHGLKGEVKVLSLSDDVKRFKNLKTVYIDGVERKIEGCKLQKDRAILKIEGINVVEETEKYKNKYLSIKREDAVELEEGCYYIADLIDCLVYDEEGTDLGKVFDVIETGSNDVYWVKNGKEELLIPALESVVTNVNIEEGKITIKPVKEWM